jgi:hypothetical protein
LLQFCSALAASKASCLSRLNIMANTNQPTTLKELKEWAEAQNLVWCKTSQKVGFTWVAAQKTFPEGLTLIAKERTELRVLQEAYAKLREGPW